MVGFDLQDTCKHIHFLVETPAAVLLWKSANLIGSPTVFYSPTENDRVRSSLSGDFS